MSKVCIPPSRLLHVHHRGCTDRPDSKVKFKVISVNRNYSLTPYQSLRSLGEGQTGRGYPIYNFRRTAGCWNLHVHLVRLEFKFVLPPVMPTSSITERKVSVMKLPPIPLDAYRMCITRNVKGWTVTQISISLLFGEYFVIHRYPAIP